MVRIKYKMRIKLFWLKYTKYMRNISSLTFQYLPMLLILSLKTIWQCSRCQIVFNDKIKSQGKCLNAMS